MLKLEEVGLANLLVHQKSNLINTVDSEPTLHALHLPPTVGVAGVVVSESGGLRPPVLGLEGVELGPGTLSSKEVK